MASKEVVPEPVHPSSLFSRISAADVELLRDHNDYSQEVRGEDSKYVVLVSADGFDFVLKRKLIRPSIQLVNMLTPPGGEDRNSVNYVILTDVNSLILKRLCEYLVYKYKYTDRPSKPVKDIPEFPIDTAISVELLLASNFLNC